MLRNLLGRIVLASTLALVAALFIAHPVPAFAADGASITIPWGEWLADVIYIVGTVAIALIAKKIHGLLDAKIGKEQTDRIEQLLQNAINFGINQTSGAVAGKAMTTQIGNAVLAQAVDYAVGQAPKLAAWAGGRDAIANKIIARLNLTSEAGS